MGSKWAVETEKLESSATRILEAVEKYNKEWNKIYEEIEALRKIEWEGEASDTFNSKIEGYRGNFEEMGKVLTNYSQILKDDASRYKKMEGEITGAASNL